MISPFSSPILTCHFWNVGQGLFSSGKITADNFPTFSWVYDCGAAKLQNPTILKNAIAQMNQNHTEKELDLVVISHFDEDHISGFSDLLKVRKVKHLLMPYYPLYQRLLLAYSMGIDTEDPNFEYFLNPVLYLSNKYSEALKDCTFLFVPAYHAENRDIPISILPNNDEAIKLFRFTEDIIPDDNLFQDTPDIKVKILKKGTALHFGIYEFFPYTVDFTARFKRLNVKNSFYVQIENIINNNPIENVPKLLQPIFKQFFKGIVQINKKKYSSINRASLFLYISEIGKVQSYLKCSQNSNIIYSICNNRSYGRNLIIRSNQNAILYTGDGYLKHDQDILHFKAVLGKKRFGNIAIFQVPHHGARGNNKFGLASEINPKISIFCANPFYSYGHPHFAVWFDFIRNIPILVDSHCKASFSIYKN